MKNFNKLFILFTFLLCSQVVSAQDNYPCPACTFLADGTVIIVPSGPNAGVYQCIDGPDSESCICIQGPGGAPCLNILPVELTGFDGQLTERNIDLKWTTATETNNEAFFIERSFDGYNFEQIARVEGAGNSVETQNYDYTDINIKNNALAGVIYYRLYQKDFDGQMAYTETIAIDLKVEVTEFAINSVLGTHLADGQIEIIYQTPTVDPVRVVLSDMSGRILQNETVYPAAGFNNYQMDISAAQSGIYVIAFIGKDKVISKKVIIQ